MGPFVSLNSSEKVTQLVELTNLVLGIRLFNKEIKKGGSSLISFEELLKYEGRNLIEKLKKEALNIIELCDKYTKFFVWLDFSKY